MLDLYSHEIHDNGWMKQHKAKLFKFLEVHYEHDRFNQKMYDVPEEIIKRELAYKLGDEIFKRDLVHFEKNFHPENFKQTISAGINVAQPGIQYANLEEFVFKVNDEEFTNDELVEAVKSYYAERLI